VALLDEAIKRRRAAIALSSIDDLGLGDLPTDQTDQDAADAANAEAETDRQLAESKSASKSDTPDVPSHVANVYGNWKKWPSISPTIAEDQPAAPEPGTFEPPEPATAVPSGHIDLAPPNIPGLKMDEETGLRYATDAETGLRVPHAELATEADKQAFPVSDVTLPEQTIEDVGPARRATLVKLPGQRTYPTVAEDQGAPGTPPAVQRAQPVVPVMPQPTGPKAPGAHTELAAPGQMDLRPDMPGQTQAVAQQPAGQPAYVDLKDLLSGATTKTAAAPETSVSGDLPMNAPNGKPPAALIIHHTSGNNSAESVVNDWRTNRPGVGAQMIMDRDGTIHDTRKEFGYGGTGNFLHSVVPGVSNQTAVGIEVIAKDDADMTPAQIESLKRLAGPGGAYANVPVYGHSQVSPGDRDNEGVRGVAAINEARKGGAQSSGDTASSADIINQIGQSGINVTHFGYKGDPDLDSESKAGHGKYVENMVPGYDVALNAAAARMVGDPLPGSEFQYAGRTWRYADKVPELYKDARFDIYDRDNTALSGGQLGAPIQAVQAGPKKQAWESWETLSPDDQARAEAQGQQAQQAKQVADAAQLNDGLSQSGNLIAYYKTLSTKPPEGVNPVVVQTFKDNLQKTITEEMRKRFPDMSPDVAWKKAQEDSSLWDIGAEFLHQGQASFAQLAPVFAQRSADKEQLNAFFDNVLPGSSDADKQALLAQIHALPREQQGPFIASKIGLPQAGQRGSDAMAVLTAIDHLSDPDFQKKEADRLAAARAFADKANTEDIRLKGSAGGAVAGAGAAAEQILAYYGIPIIGAAQAAEETRRQMSKEHPDWDEARLDQESAFSSLAKVYGNTIAATVMGSGAGLLLKSLTTPWKRAAGQVLAGTLTNMGISGGTTIATNIAEGKPAMLGVGESVLTGGVQGALFGGLHGAHELMTSAPAPSLAVGPHGEPVRGAEGKTLEQPPPVTPPPLGEQPPVPPPTTGPAGGEVRGAETKTLEEGQQPPPVTAQGEPVRPVEPVQTEPSVNLSPEGEAPLTEPNANTHAPVAATPTSEVPIDPIAQANSRDTELKAKMQSLQELTGYSHVLPTEAQADLGAAMGPTEGTVQPARRAGAADTPALPRTELDRAVERFRSQYSGSAPIEVVNNASELPANVRAVLHAQDAHENISAFVHSHPETGEKIYVLADRQHSLANLTGDLMEEAIGHSGVRAVLPPDQMQRVTQAIDNRFSNDRSYLRLLRQGYEKGQAAEEFLAKLAREPERAPQFVNGVISYIAEKLRKVANRMGLDFQITKPELQHIIARARRWVETPRPERVGVMTTEPSFRAHRMAPSVTTEEKVRRFESAAISKDSAWKAGWNNFTNALGGFRGAAPKVGLEKEAYRRGESVPIQHWLRYLRGIDGKTQNDAANQIRHVIDPLLKVPGELHPELVDRWQKINRQIAELKAAGKTVPPKLLAEQKRLDGFTKSSPFWLFNRKVLYNDLYARSQIQYGVDSAGRAQYQDLPSGFTRNEVVAQLQELNRDIAKLTPEQQNAITESLRRHYQMVHDIKGDLTRRGYVIPKEFANPFYYPHILLDHTKGYLARARHSTEEDFRGYLVDPVGSEKLIETSYTKAMMQHLTEVMSHNARHDATAELLKPLDQAQVFKDQIKAENRERALKGQAPLSLRTWETRAREAGYEIYAPDKHIPMRMEAMIDREKLSKQLGRQINEGDLVENLKRMGVTLTADDLRTALAAGTREKWAITPEQHAALRDVTGKIEADRAEKSGWGHNLTKLTQAPLSLWKQYKLHSPTAAARYHYGNLTSDMEKIFTADPKVFKHLPEAYRLMSQYNKEGRYPNDRFMKAVEHDVIETPTAQETSFLRQALPQFEDLMSRKEKNLGKIRAFWEASQRFGNIRESTFRLAKYLADMDRLDKGQSYEKGQIPAAALYRDLAAHKTNEAKAAQNAREMFIDYKAISPAGQFLRKNLIPFYFRNMLDMSVPNKSEFMARGGRALATIPSKVLLARSTRGFLLRLGVANAALAGWNAYVMQRDKIKTTDLSDEDRRKSYILLGKDKEGKVGLMYVPTAEADFLGWLGGPAFGQLAGDYLGGRITLQQAATDWVKTFTKDELSKIVNSIRPEFKAGLGFTMGRDFFPDATDPKRIKSFDMPGWLIAQAFDQPTADLVESFRDPNSYRNKSWADTAKQVVLQIRQRDPEQWAYYDIQNKVQDFLESKGYGPHGESAETPGSQVVRNFKRAVFNGDIDAAQRFAQILVDKYGYNSEKFAASIRAQEPMAAIKKELKPEFVKTLSESDKEQLQKAYAYYAHIRGGESKAQAEARAIFGPKARPTVVRAALAEAIQEARDSSRRAAAAAALMKQNPVLRAVAH
jgi:hypothetical protein